MCIRDSRESIVAQMSDSYAAQMGVSRDEVVSYIEKMDDETLFSYVEDMVREQIAAQYAEATRAQLSSMTVDQLAAALDMTPRTEEQTQYLYDNYMPATVSDSTYDDVLAALGYVDLASPSKVKMCIRDSYHIHPHFARAKITVRSRFGKLYVKPLLCPSISIRLAGQRVEKILLPRWPSRFPNCSSLEICLIERERGFLPLSL